MNLDIKDKVKNPFKKFLTNIFLGIFLLIVAFGGTIFGSQIFNSNKVNDDVDAALLGWRRTWIVQHHHYDQNGNTTTTYSYRLLQTNSTSNAHTYNAVGTGFTLGGPVGVDLQGDGSDWDWDGAPSPATRNDTAGVYDYTVQVRWKPAYYNLYYCASYGEVDNANGISAGALFSKSSTYGWYFGDSKMSKQYNLTKNQKNFNQYTDDFDGQTLNQCDWAGWFGAQGAEWLVSVEGVSTTISFDSNGGSSVSSVTAYYNEYLPKAGVPTKTGYTFNGWYDSNGTQYYDASGNPVNTSYYWLTEDTTLYASWLISDNNIISFDAQDGFGKNLLRYNESELPSGITYNQNENYFTINGSDSKWTDYYMAPTLSFTASQTITANTKFLIYYEYLSGSVTTSGSSTNWIMSQSVPENGKTSGLTIAQLNRVGAFTKSNITSSSKVLKVYSVSTVSGSPKRVQLYILQNGWTYSNLKFRIAVYAYSASNETKTPDTLAPLAIMGTSSETVDILPNIVKSGYAFDGWYTQTEGNGTILSTTTKYSNTTVYANWLKKLNVNYVANGENSSAKFKDGTTSKSDVVFSGTNETYRGKNMFDPNGYLYNTGWMSIENSNVIRVGQKLTSTQYGLAIGAFKNDGKDLPIRFSSGIAGLAPTTQYTLVIGVQTLTYPSSLGDVSFVLSNGGSDYLSGITQTPKITLSGVGIYSTTFMTGAFNSGVRDYSFDSSLSFSNACTSTPVVDITFWIAIFPGTQTLDFSSVASTTSAVTSANPGLRGDNNFKQDVFDASNLIEPDNYVLVNWTTNKNNKIVGSIDDVIQETEDHNVVAKFSQSVQTVTVTLKANGGTFSDGWSSKTKTVTVGSTYGTLPEPTRTDYEFYGWWTGTSSGATRVYSSTEVTNTSNHTLYAWWEKTSTEVIVTINFAGNGGSSFQRSYTAGTTFGTLPTPTRTDYEFNGWWTTQTGGTRITSSSIVPDVNTTYYAHWTTTLMIFDTTWQTQIAGTTNGIGIAANTITSIRFETSAPAGYTFSGKSLESGIQIYTSGTASSPSTDVAFVASSQIYAPTDSKALFSRLTSLVDISFNNFDTSKVTLLGYSNSSVGMFEGCTSLKMLDLSSFNTTKVTYAQRMFLGCTSLISLDLSTFTRTTGRIPYIRMLTDCTSLKVLKTPSNANAILPTLPKAMIDTDDSNTEYASGTNYTCFAQSHTLKDASSTVTFDTTWQTQIAGTTNGIGLNVEDITSIRFETSIPSGYMYTGKCLESGILICTTGTPTNPSTDIAFVWPDTIFAPADCDGLFSNLSSLTEISSNNFDVTNITNISSMFEDCSSLTELDLSFISFSEYAEFENVLYGCDSLETFKTPTSSAGDDAPWCLWGLTLYDTDNGIVYDYDAGDYFVLPATSHTLISSLPDYIITFVVNDENLGSVDKTEVVVPYGATFTANGNKLTSSNGITVTATAKTINGYNIAFNKWANYPSKVKQGSTVTANFTQSVITYSISYTLNGGTGTDSVTSYNVQTQTFMLINPTRTGYTFAGWTGSNGDTPQVSVKIEKGSTGNKSFTANWEPISTTITASETMVTETWGYANTISVADITASGGGDKWTYSLVDANANFVLSNTSATTGAVSLTFKTGAVAGTYTCKVKATSEYNSTSATTEIITVVINKADASFTFEDKTVDYDGTAKSITATNIVGGTIAYFESETGEYVATAPTYTEAGTYTIVAKLIGDSNHNDLIKSANLTINQKSISVPTAITGLVYNGKVQAGVVAGTGYSVTGNTATNAGTYSATVDVLANYQWSDGTTTSKTISWEISQFNLSGATIASVADQTYTGSAITPTPAVTAVLATGETATTLSSSTDFTYSYASNTNAGQATITITGKGNYTGTKSITFNITKLAVTKPTAKTGLVYTGASQTGVTYQTGTGYSLSSGTTSGINAQSYSAIFALDANHKWSDNTTANLTISWTIDAKSVSVVWANTSFAYDGASHAPTATATGVSGETLNLTVSGAQTNVGDYTASAVLSSVTGGQAKTSNYTLTNTSVKFNIISSSGEVAFDANGGTSSEEKRTFTYPGTYGTLPEATRTGYTFNGWWTAKTDGTQVLGTTQIPSASSHTLYAHWTVNTYTVTFDQNNGVNPNLFNEEWLLKSSHITKVDTGYKATAYAITDINIVSELKSILKAGVTYTLSRQVTGYLGSNSEVSGSIRIRNASGNLVNINPGNGVKSATFTFTQEQIDSITGFWIYGPPASYTTDLIFNYVKLEEGDTATGYSPSSKTVTYDSAYGTLPTATRTGYTFDGWSKQLYFSDEEKTATREFVQYADFAPYIDQYGLVEYILEFDMKSKDVSQKNTIGPYFQNGAGAKYGGLGGSFTVTTEYQHYVIKFTPKLADSSQTASTLAFYGTYNTGNIPVIKNVRLVVTKPYVTADTIVDTAENHTLYATWTEIPTTITASTTSVSLTYSTSEQTVADITASGGGDKWTYSLTGTNADKFTLSTTDETTGAVTLKLKAGTAVGSYKVQVKATSAYNGTSATTSAITVTVNNATLTGSVAVSGTARYAETLTATVTGTISGTSLAYAWYSNSTNVASGGTQITGATQSTYTIGKGLVGKYIYVVVTMTKANYTTSTISALASSAVAKRDITISGVTPSATVTKVYDGTTSVKQTFTTSLSGLISGDTVNYVLSSATYNNANVGTGKTINLTFTASGADIANYNCVLTAKTTGEITKATLNVVADNKSAVYGDDLPSYTYSISGFVNNETDAVVTTKPTLSCGYKKFDNVGSFDITASGAVATNYEFNYSNGTLTVTQRTVTATWPEVTTFGYDGNSHSVVATIGNLVNSDAVTFTYTGTTTATNAGNYTATISALSGTKAGNYALPSNKTQSWKITQKEVTLTVDASKTVVYGSTATVSYKASVAGKFTITSNSETYVTVASGYTQTVVANTAYTFTINGVKAGSGTITVSFQPTDSTNYTAPANKTVSVTIDKATISNVPSQSGTLTYTGTSQTPSFNNYSTTILTIGGTTSAIDAGNYTATFTPTSNYKWSDGTTTAKSVSWTIGKKSVAVVWTNTSFAYDGASHAPTATATGVSGETLNLTVSGAQTNVGDYTATATLSSVTDGQAKTSNYTLTNTSVKFNIISSSGEVAFDANGGTSSEEKRTFTYPGTYGTLPEATRTGYTFNGWWTAKTDGTQVLGTTQIPSASSHTLYAHWTVNTYTVTFDQNNGVNPNLFNEDWLLKSSHITKVDTGYKATGYAITDINIVSELKSILKAGVTYTLSRQVTGYVGAACGTVGIMGPSNAYLAKVNPGNDVKSATFTFTQEQIDSITGFWIYGQNASYTTDLIFNYVKLEEGDTATGYSPSSKTVTYDSAYGTLPTATRSYYTFDGWWTEKTGGTKVTESTIVTRTENHTLYAHFTEKTVQVVIKKGSNIESVVDTSGTYTFGQVVSLNATVGTGYHFVSWTCSPTKAIGDATSMATSYMITEEDIDAGGTLTFTSSAEIDSYKITYLRATGGVISTLSTQTQNFGASLKALSSVNGHDVTGWFANQFATGSSFTTIDETLLSEFNYPENGATIILYEIDTPKTYTITYYLNGTDSIYKTETYTYGSAKSLITKFDVLHDVEPDRYSDYVFYGWFDSEPSGNLKELKTTTSLSNTDSGNKTFYAKYFKARAQGVEGYSDATITINVSLGDGLKSGENYGTILVEFFDEELGYNRNYTMVLTNGTIVLSGLKYADIKITIKTNLNAKTSTSSVIVSTSYGSSTTVNVTVSKINHNGYIDIGTI